MTNQVFVLVAMTVAAGWSCVTNADQHRRVDEARSAIVEAIRQYDSLSNRDSAGKFTELWTENGVQMPPGEPVVTGHAAIAARHEAQRESAVQRSKRSELVTLTVPGDRAVARINVVETPELAGQVTASPREGNLVRIYERQPDGGWLLDLEIWNWVDSGRGRAP